LVRVQRNLCQTGCAQCRPYVATRAVIKLQAADIRQHLPPVAASRASADEGNAGRFKAAVVNHIHPVCQRIANALQHRTRQFGWAMLMR